MSDACKHPHKSLEIQTELSQPICTAENNYKNVHEERNPKPYVFCYINKLTCFVLDQSFTVTFPLL